MGFDYKQYDGLGLAELIREKEVKLGEVREMAIQEMEKKNKSLNVEANLTGQPAMTLPMHLTKDGLPCGVQVMARRGREDLLLQLAGQLEQSDAWIKVKDNPIY